MPEIPAITEDPIYRHLAEALHLVWERIDWSKMSTSYKRRTTDIFQHRLKKASSSSNLNQLIERLSKGTSVQSIAIWVALIAKLQEDEQKTLNVIREESVVLSSLAKSGPGPIDELRRKLREELQGELDDLDGGEEGYKQKLERRLENIDRIEQEIAELYEEYA